MSRIDRIKYIAEMKALLSFMDEADRRAVLRRYEDIFDEAGESGESDVIRQLGSPVRQILQVEKEYREREEAGLPGFAVGETANEPPAFQPEYAFAPASISTQAVEPPEAYYDEAPLEPAPDDAQPETPIENDTAYAQEPAAATQEPVLYEEETPNGEEARSDAAEPEPQEPEDESDSFDEGDGIGFVNEPTKSRDAAAAFAAALALEERPARPTAPAQPVFQASEEETEDDEEEETQEQDEPVTTGRIVGAVFLTPVMIVLALLGILLTLALSVLGFAPGAGTGAAAVYLTLYALAGMSYLPDMLMVLGAAVVCLALAILFLWFGIWLAVEGVALTVRVISRIYGSVLRKGGRGNV